MKATRTITRAAQLANMSVGQRNAEQKRIGRRPQKLLENNDARTDMMTGEKLSNGSICKVMRKAHGTHRQTYR